MRPLYDAELDSVSLSQWLPNTKQTACTERSFASHRLSKLLPGTFGQPSYRNYHKGRLGRSGAYLIRIELPVSHHLESPCTYSVDDLGALCRIGDLQLLLKKYRCLLV